MCLPSEVNGHAWALSTRGLRLPFSIGANRPQRQCAFGMPILATLVPCQEKTEARNRLGPPNARRSQQQPDKLQPRVAELIRV